MSTQPLVTDPDDESRASVVAARPPERVSKRAREVSALVAQLARAARSYPLYDPGNAALQRSLAALGHAFAGVLEASPRLRLEIAPFEILCEGHRVYQDRDCERSLAFRLFGDGVRALVFHAGTDEAELTRLVAVLASRFSGVDHEEEDVVTMLFRERLRSVEVVAVFGLTQDAGQAGVPSEDSAAFRSSPEEVDLPLPQLDAEEAPQRDGVPASVLERLRREVQPGDPVGDGIRLLASLGRALEDPRERMRFSELTSFCAEMRETLLSIGLLPELIHFVRELRKISLSDADWDPERHQAVVSAILSCGSDAAVRRLVHSVPPGVSQVPAGFTELLDLACPDPPSAVAGALAVEVNASGRAVARQLLEHYGRRHGPWLRQRFQEARGQAAADFLRSLARLEDGATSEFMARQCGHPDPEVRAEALWHLERTAFTSALGQALVEALRRTQGADRLRILAIVERSRDRRFVPAMVGLLEGGELSTPDATDVARVIGRLEGGQGLERWRRQLTPGGSFFRRRLPGSARQQRIAATAVSQVPGEEAAHLLRLALAGADREMRPYLERLLEERGAGRGGRRAS